MRILRSNRIRVPLPITTACLAPLTTRSARQSFFLKRRDRVTGFGYSLVYPGCVRRAPPESRGLAMVAYTVFLGSPALGLIAAWRD
jgi:hypothetical protein